MGRSHEEDIAMRVALNKVIAVANSETPNSDAPDAGGVNLIDAWTTYFRGREINHGDYDPLKSLVTLMAQELPTYTLYGVLMMSCSGVSSLQCMRTENC